MVPKKKVFSKVKAVKDAARVTLGEPKATRVIPDDKARTKMRGGKHKKADQLLEDE
jgi:hypothetical protein